MDNGLDEVLNLPDLHFVQFCEWKFQLNRGIYNNIDIWFYEKGIKSVVNRRKTIFQFLYFTSSSSTKKVKFGSGGLKIKLEEFWGQSKVYDVENVSKC